MVREVVEIQNCIDPDANLHRRLSGRREIDQQYFLLARSVLGLRRWSGSKRILVFLRGQQTQISVSQSVQLSTGREYPVEARHLTVKHQVEVALNGVEQGMVGRTVRHRRLAFLGADAINRDTRSRGMSLRSMLIIDHSG